jgi:hypothetical protein
MSQDIRGRDQRWRYLAAITLFLALLALLQISAPRASLSILWRYVVISFDNPATQVLDELALEKTSFTDPLDDLLELGHLATSSSRPILPPPADGGARSDILFGRISRAPPLA